VLDLDLLDPSLYRHGMPHELYAELREVGPVLWHPRIHVPAFVPAFGTDIDFWAVIGHKEVEQANRDWETFSPTTARLVPFPPECRGIMFVTKDPPEYNRIRRHISAGFTPHIIGRLEDQIRARTGRILDDAAARGDFDFAPAIAYQLPMHVIADIPEADRPEVFRLTDLIMRATYASNPRRRQSCPISPYPLRLPRDRSAHSGDRANRLSDHGSLIARTL
jgi:cytochrome P450